MDARLLATLAIIFILLISGCVTETLKTSATTTITAASTTTTTITITTTTTTTTLIAKLTKWTKEKGTRIANGISSSTIIKNSEYWMYYTGSGIELATSQDGLNFINKGAVIAGAAGSEQDMVTNPAVFQISDGRYRMIYEGARVSKDETGKNYQTDRKLYSAISSDGTTWTKESGTRFWDYGDGKPGEIFTSVPDVIKLSDGRLRMYYTRGATSATALSSDEGLTWLKEANLDLHRKVAVDLDILRLDGGSYKLFFTTFEDEFGIGEQWVVGASSLDGIDFILDQGKIIEPATSGGLVTDPDVIKIDNGYRMYYGEFKKGEYESNIISAFSAG